MKVRASIGLTIDIDSEREMGLEIEDSDVNGYAIECLIDYVNGLIKAYGVDIRDVVKVETIEEEK